MNPPEYVRLKVNSTRKNRAKGFYILMTQGDTYSDRKNEFIVERKFIDILNKNNIKFEELPLNA